MSLRLRIRFGMVATVGVQHMHIGTSFREKAITRIPRVRTMDKAGIMMFMSE